MGNAAAALGVVIGSAYIQRPSMDDGVTVSLMRYPPHLLDEIRARLPVSDVVGRKVRLTKKGREYAGLSPFNPEKTPSFFVNDQKGFYHCFSSGRHGDIFRFLMETEGLTFPEAIERLAAEAGVDLPKPDPRDAERERARASLADVCEMAAKFFEDSFRLSGGEAARAYAAKRGLTAETIKTFRVGYAPQGRDLLKRYLTGKGVPEADMLEAGLLVAPDDGRPSYDYFRNRLIIPIEDERGRVVAFGGRALSPDDKPKYLNSRETPLFHKGLMLFNGHRARAAAREASTVIVVEGYLDAIAVYQAGIPGVVATLGTAFTEEQIGKLWRLAPEPVVCFDGDKAGIAAAHRAIDRILPVLKSGYSFQFAILPDGKDPDELIASSGRAGFLAEIERATPLADVLWERETRAAPIDTPERRAALEKRFDELVNGIKDPLVAKSYRASFRPRLSNLFWTASRPPRGKGGFDRKAAPAEPTAEARLPAAESELAGLERIVLGLCLEYPDLFERHFDRLAALPFAIDAHEGFKQELHRLAVDGAAVSVAGAYESVDPRFYFVLNEVHGEETVDPDGRITVARGHRLRDRFPILKFHPPDFFIEDCFVHLMDRLEIRAMETDLEAAIAAAGAECTAAEETRIIELSREIARLKETYQRDEQSLAEIAKQVRSASRLAGTDLPSTEMR